MLAPPKRAASACSLPLHAIACVAIAVAALAAASPAGAAPAKSMWLTQSEITGLPMTGSAWAAVKAAADGSLGTPRISDQNSGHDITNPGSRARLCTNRRRRISREGGRRDHERRRHGGGWQDARARPEPRCYVIAADLINLKSL